MITTMTTKTKIAKTTITNTRITKKITTKTTTTKPPKTYICLHCHCLFLVVPKSSWPERPKTSPKKSKPTGPLDFE